jgi:hypothetical protein
MRGEWRTEWKPTFERLPFGEEGSLRFDWHRHRDSSVVFYADCTDDTETARIVLRALKAPLSNSIE